MKKLKISTLNNLTVHNHKQKRISQKRVEVCVREIYRVK